MKGITYFVSGIDTGIGKSVATGVLANRFKKEGKKVITQKMIQTGCSGTSEDIVTHRKIMGESLNAFDQAGTTCPYVFKYPSSPHLAAALEERSIDTHHIRACTEALEDEYDIVLLEGAGGLMVPIYEYYHIIDYVREMNYALFLVTSGKLGSINHTLLSLEICRQRNIRVEGLVYNHFPDNDEFIVQNSRKLFFKHLSKYNLHAEFIDLEEVRF